MDKLKFIVLFLIISIFNIFYLNSNKEKSNTEYIDAMTTKNVMAYETIYNQYKQLSNVIYTELMLHKKILSILKNVKTASNEEKNKLRQQLYDSIITRYSNLTKFHLRQLHFHLPNNESFLRFHKPSKYGDNLTGFRKTVEYVNKNKISIDGFEEGRIYNGFRFVYPIIDSDNEHLGSVEVSFGADAFINSLMQEYDVVSNFFIKSSIVDQKVFNSEKSNYIFSCQNGYLNDKNVLEVIEREKGIKVQDMQSSDDTRLKINTLIEKQNVVSLYDKEHNWLVTAIAFHNPITKKMVAFLTIRSKSIFFDKMEENYIKNLLFSELFISILLFFIYREMKSKNSMNKLLSQKVEEQTRHLVELNESLEQKVQQAVQEVKDKDQIIIAQSRHAAMGEMISMIAHQWRQPLSVIAMSVNNTKLDIELGELDEKQLKSCAEEIEEQIQYLSKTINDFSDFFKPNKELTEISFNVLVENTVKIVGKSLENNKINLIVDVKTNDTISTHSNELIQVMINILNNAKEACIDNEIQEPQIKILCQKTDDLYQISIEDNAGGIPKQYQEKIYEPYFSTKMQKNGTGLGLYMSKTIIEEHLQGRLDNTNSDEGAIFTIELPKEIKA